MTVGPLLGNIVTSSEEKSIILVQSVIIANLSFNLRDRQGIAAPSSNPNHRQVTTIIQLN